MKKLAALLSTTAVAVGTTTCSVPAHADPEVSALQLGKADRGWVRASCLGTGTDTRCDIRLPAGAKTWRIKYYDGKDWLGTEENYPNSPGPHTSQSLVVLKPVDEMRIACEKRGGLVLCEVKARARVTDFDITLYSDGMQQGGLIWEEY